MKYSIISINDKREDYKKNIRENVGLEELEIRSIDGSVEDIAELMHHWDLRFTQDWVPSKGEIGVWLSNFIRWMIIAGGDEPVVVFEDDAIIHPNFKEQLEHQMSQLPAYWDFFSLWVPENQRQDYMYELTYDYDGAPVITGRRTTDSKFDFGASSIAEVYQGYGLVATVYSPKGAEHLVELARGYGIYTPVDCFLMLQAHRGHLSGYAPKPSRVFVDYDWPETQIHNTELIK